MFHTIDIFKYITQDWHFKCMNNYLIFVKMLQILSMALSQI